MESTGSENEGATRIHRPAAEQPPGTAEVGAEGDRARAAEGESVGSIAKRPNGGEGVPQTMERARKWRGALFTVRGKVSNPTAPRAGRRAAIVTATALVWDSRGAASIHLWGDARRPPQRPRRLERRRPRAMKGKEGARGRKVGQRRPGAATGHRAAAEGVAVAACRATAAVVRGANRRGGGRQPPG